MRLSGVRRRTNQDAPTPCDHVRLYLRHIAINLERTQRSHRSHSRRASHRIRSRSADLAKSRPRTIEPNLKPWACVRVCPPRPTINYTYPSSSPPGELRCLLRALLFPQTRPSAGLPSQLTKITIQPVQRRDIALPSSPCTSRPGPKSGTTPFPCYLRLVSSSTSAGTISTFRYASSPSWERASSSLGWRRWFVNLKKGQGRSTDRLPQPRQPSNSLGQIGSCSSPLRARAVFRKSQVHTAAISIYITAHPSLLFPSPPPPSSPRFSIKLLTPLPFLLFIISYFLLPLEKEPLERERSFALPLVSPI